MDNMTQVVAAIDAAHSNPGPRPERGLVDKDSGTTLTAPTPSLHPAVIRHIEGYGELTAPYLKPAEEAFDIGHKAVQTIIDARKAVSQNTAWHPDRQLLSIADLAEKKQTEATKAFDSARTRLMQGLKALDESLNAPLTQDSNAGSINGEVRNHLKGLKREERLKLLEEAFETKDLLTLRAVLSGPGFLSGITEDERKLRITMFHRMTQPDIARRADVMRRAIELIETNGPLLLPQVEMAIGGTGSWRRVTAARQRNKAAEDALKIA